MHTFTIDDSAVQLSSQHLKADPWEFAPHIDRRQLRAPLTEIPPSLGCELF